jgi:hypothetical protein
MREMKLNKDAADSGYRIPSSWPMRIWTRVADEDAQNTLGLTRDGLLSYEER